jgi:hypothetical protein
VIATGRVVLLAELLLWLPVIFVVRVLPVLRHGRKVVLDRPKPSWNSHGMNVRSSSGTRSSSCSVNSAPLGYTSNRPAMRTASFVRNTTARSGAYPGSQPCGGPSHSGTGYQPGSRATNRGRPTKNPTRARYFDPVPGSDAVSYARRIRSKGVFAVGVPKSPDRGTTRHALDHPHHPRHHRSGALHSRLPPSRRLIRSPVARRESARRPKAWAPSRNVRLVPGQRARR